MNLPTLTFHGTDPYFRESSCGLYRVVKVIILGKERYESYRRRERNWELFAVNLSSVEAAREACQCDQDGRSDAAAAGAAR